MITTNLSMNSHSLPRLDHIAACAGHQEANLNFYGDFLGLDLLPSAEEWRLYGAPSDSGRPCLAFRFDAAAPSGRRGAGQAVEICLAIPEGTAGHWRERAAAGGWVFCPAIRFGCPGLRLRDPDGMPILLAERTGVTSPTADILGLCGTTLWVRDPLHEAALLTDIFGCDDEGIDGGIRRLRLGDTHLDLQDAREFPDGCPGRGVIEYLVLGGCQAVRASADRLLVREGAGWLLPGGIRLRLSP